MKTEEQKKAEQPIQEFETKKKNKKTTSQMQYDTSNYAIPPNIRKQFRTLEDTLFLEDHSILDFKATKNELESFLVEMRFNLDNYGPLEKYIDPTNRETFLAEINKAYDWLYGEG